MNKKLAYLLSAALLCAFFTSCGGAQKNTLSCDELGNELMTALDEKVYEKYPEEQLSLIFGDKKPYEDGAVFYSAETNDIDEFGIFKASDLNSIDTLQATLEAYLNDYSRSQRSFIMSYAPDEVTKLNRAEVTALGNYVVYFILGEDDSTVFLQELKEELER